MCFALASIRVQRAVSLSPTVSRGVVIPELLDRQLELHRVLTISRGAAEGIRISTACAPPGRQERHARATSEIRQLEIPG